MLTFEGRSVKNKLQ